MNTVPAAIKQLSDDGAATACGPLDAFVAGEISADALGRALSAVCESSPDAAWEVLALLDQYHRRRLLSAELFHSLKARINRMALMQPAGDSVQDVRAGARPEPQDPGDDAEKRHERPSPAAPGRVLDDRYVIEGVLGRGGMATVFRALDRQRADLPERSRYVAVKVLNPELSHQPEVIAAFRNEFYQAQRLSHPGIVNVFDFGSDGDTHFFTMELLEGEVLSRLLERIQPRVLARPQALAIVREVGLALACAHERGVAHGGLKAGHVIILGTGEVRVVGFGAARAGDDVFSLACLAYELLAGTQPFRRQPASVARHQKRTRPIPGLSRRQWRTLSAGLASTPEQRPFTLREWLAGLDLEQAALRLPPLDALETQPAAGNRILLPAMLATLVLLLVAAAFVMRDDIARLLPLPNPEPDRGTVASDPILRPDVNESTSGTELPSGMATPPTEGAAGELAESESETAAIAGAASGPGRISFAQDTYIVNPGDGAARLVLQRSGGVSGGVAFSWWTEEGSAIEGEDFMPMGSRSESLRDGESQLIVFIPIVSDPTRRTSQTFYVHVGETRGGLQRGGITRATVIINAAFE